MLSPQEQRFFINWTGIVGIGWFLSSLAFGAATLTITLADMYGTLLPPHNPLFPIALGKYLAWHAIMWAAVGFMQWGCIQAMIPGTVWWRVGWSGLSALSWTGLWVLMYSGDVSDRLVESALGGAFLIGLVQWVFLRWHLVYAGWWIAANVGAIGLISSISGAFAVIDWLVHFNHVSNWFILVGTLCIPGLVYGASTGFVMVLLLRTTIHRHQFQGIVYHSALNEKR